MNEKIKRKAHVKQSFSLDFLERGTFTEYPYGAVSSVKVIMDRETGKSKGFAFIEMEDDAAAAKAIAELNGAEYMGRTMVVKEARPKA